jgi:Leucine-rich repeat (LRR) protein
MEHAVIHLLCALQLLNTYELIALSRTSSHVHSSMRRVDLNLFSHPRSFTATEFMNDVIKPTRCFWRITGLRMSPADINDRTVSARFVTPNTVRMLRLIRFTDIHRHLRPLALRTLDIRDPGMYDPVTGAIQLFALMQCVNLVRLNLSQAGFTNLVAVGFLTKLRILDLTDCVSLVDLTPLRSLQRLEVMILTGCRALVELRGLECCLMLRFLHLRGCKLLIDITALSACHNLETIDVDWCSRLPSLAGLEGKGSLRQVRADGCMSLRGIDSLATCPVLTTIGLSQSQVSCLSPLAGLTRLRTLVLTRCRALRAPALGSLRNLRQMRGFWFTATMPSGVEDHVYWRSSRRLHMGRIIQHLRGP